MGKILGISALAIKKGNWNNGFDGLARKTSDGVVFATDKSRKYSLRADMKSNQNDFQKVLISSMKDGDKYLSLDGILERHNLLENKVFNKVKLMKEYIDVRLFGAVIASSGNNIGITGPFSMNFGTNVYLENGMITNNESMIQISSYLVGGKTKKNGEESAGTQTTLGTQNMIENAVLSFPFTFNPILYRKNIRDFVNEEELSDDALESLLIDDINLLKSSMSYDATNMRSCFKMGTNNLFNVFIETVNDDDNINFISLEKIFVEEENQLEYVVDMDSIISLIKENEDKIRSVEIHKVNSVKIDFKNLNEIPKGKLIIVEIN